jgi:hypothetical protein
MVPEAKLPQVLEKIDQVSREINTVFSADIITRAAPDGAIPYLDVLRKMNRYVSINGKSNIGLGRPLAPI